MYVAKWGKPDTDTFGGNNAHLVSKEYEGAMCSVTHASERQKIKDNCPRKFLENNGFFHGNLHSKREVQFHLDIKFLLLFGNFSIAQAFLAFQRKSSSYCIPLGMRSLYETDFDAPLQGSLSRCIFFTTRILILGEKQRNQEKHTEAGP